MSRKRKTTEEDDLEEIRKGFEKFDVNGTGIINPSELLEAMDAMNIKEKNPFIYEIIESLNSEKDIKKKGGVNLDELVSYVYQKVNDTETNMGLRQIHEVINDRDTDTISMSTFYDLARKYGDKLTEDELRMLLEKTQMGGNDLTFDEFYTIMKGSGKDNSSMNMSRSSFRNKNNNSEVYVRKSNNNSNIIDNNNSNIMNNSKIRTKKYIYKEQTKKEIKPEPEPEPEPEQEQKQEQEQNPEQEQEQEKVENNNINNNNVSIEENKEIDFELDRRFESPKQNYIEEYHEEHIIEEDQIPPQENNNINVELSQQNQIQEEEYQYNPINPVEEQHQELNISQDEDTQRDYGQNLNAYSKDKDNNDIYSSPKIINPNDINESQNMNELNVSHPKNENSEIELDIQRNSEAQSETSSQYKYSYRKRKIGAAPIHEKIENNSNTNEGQTKYTKEKETKITNLPNGGKQIEITEKTEVVKEKPYSRGYRSRFGRYKNEENDNNNNNNNKNVEEKKEDKKEEKKSYYRIRKPFSRQNEEQVAMTKVNGEENNEVNIPKRYHRRYRESKASSNNQ